MDGVWVGLIHGLNQSQKQQLCSDPKKTRYVGKKKKVEEEKKTEKWKKIARVFSR